MLIDDEIRKKPVSTATLGQEEAKAGAKSSGSRNEEETSVFKSNRVNNDDYYNDSDKKSAKQTLGYLNGSSLFAGEGMTAYCDRIAKAVDNLLDNESWRLSIDIDGDGNPDDVKLADAILESGDSELDIYVQAKVDEVINKYGTCSRSYLSDDAIAELEAAGIRVDSVGASDGKNSNRVYAFTLVDDEGNVIEDENGNAGNYIMADCLIPDGYAQGAERELVSIMDSMGYDCISKADFVGRESDYYDLIAQVEENLQNGVYESGGSIDTLYGNIKDIKQSVSDLWGGRGSAPGTHSTAGEDYVNTTGDPNSLDEEEAIDSDAAQRAYEARLETAKAEYKAQHGKDPEGNDLTQLIAEVKAQVATYYGEDIVEQLEV